MRFGSPTNSDHKDAPARLGAGSGLPTHKVWDRGVRWFHWGLVLAVSLGALTGFLAPTNWLDLHLWSGAAVAVLILFRVIWGWTGSTFARFSSFPVAPSHIAEHLSGVAKGSSTRHLGHNPLGALMVYALLAVLTFLVASGSLALGGVLKQGPFAFATSYATGSTARNLHEWLAIGLLVLIGGHLAGVIFESIRSKENLARAMVTGVKRAEPSDATPIVAGRPVAAAAMLAVLLALIIPTAFALASKPGLGVPTASLDPVYAKECGSCHFAYPPSLLPKASWSALMAGLDDHFGENAALDPATSKAIGAWLEANASEGFDTRPAHFFARTNPDDPFRITTTPAWLRIHDEIPDATFKSAAIGSKGACNACHQDAATGRFDPQRIAIPTEVKS